MKRLTMTLLVALSASTLFGQDRAVVLYNSGAMHVGGDTQSSSPVSLYIRGTLKAGGSSAIAQTGKSVLTGDLINNTTSGTVFDATTRSGSIELRSTGAQYIRGTADKSTSYVHFPATVIVNNQNTNPDSVALVIDPLQGATVKNLDIRRGRVILDSKTNGERRSYVGHLLVEPDGNITYNRTPTDKHEQGIIQVNLALGNNYNEKRLIGFTPPFQKIYADYFMFNFLSAPSNKGLFGDTYSLIADPRTPMQAGRGYIVGQTLIPEGNRYYDDELDPEFVDAAFDDRAKEKLSFARAFAPTSLTQYVNGTTSLTDQFAGEDLCYKQDVKIMLGDKFNYVGNPYTVPLDMSDFVKATATPDAWGVTRSADGSGEVRNSFYVMSEGTGSYHPDYHFSSRFQFNVSYLLGQEVGGTLNYEGYQGSLLVAPMQMFIVGCNVESKELTIPLSARKHGNASFLRSTPSSVHDELLIETKDSRTEGYDRLCVVFREEATTVSNDPYDAVKIFNESGGVNQIYTKSLDDKAMTANVVPPTLKNLVMYFKPAEVEQEVTLGAYRISSLSSVKSVILEDTQMKVKTDLLQKPDYTFVSSPSDKEDRFVLHFDTRATTGIEEEQDAATAINLFYHAGIIYIQGLTDEHLGSQVTVFALNGQQLLRQAISNVPDQQISISLLPGTYMVKLQGDMVSVAKKMLVK